MSKRTSKAPPLSPQAHQQLRTKLGAITKSIQAGQLQSANASLQPLLRKHPSVHEVCHVASGLSAAQRETDRALYYAQRAAELAPDIAQYHAAVGTLLLQQDKIDDAIEPLQTALRLSPELTQAHVAMGTARMQQGEIDQARKHFARVLQTHPADREAANNLALLESDTAHAHRAVEITEHALKHLPEDPLLLDALCMYACYDDTLSPQQVFAIHQRFGQSVQSRVRTPRRYTNTPNPDRRIRLGFVSPDLRTHSIAYFIQPIIEHLDRDRFEVCMYHTSTATDAMTQRLRELADQWNHCPKGIAQAHKQISTDHIDILIELNGHFAGNLLPLFAAKPTPVSISMIGYANTTGLPSMTARIIDIITDPAPQADALATESLIRVPGCFLCYRPPADAPHPTAPAPDRPFTFGSFNDLRKMSPSTIETWAAILKACPDARLLLKTARLAHTQVRDELHQRFASLGIAPDRIELLGRTESMHDHLDLYNRIDCALDTFPYTGTTTTCEALHMGVPTITLLGHSHAGRVSASLLHAIDAPQWITHDHDAYIQRAIDTCAVGPRTQDQRRALRTQLAKSPLCDAQTYTAGIAEAFTSLWQAWCAENRS
jgi:predicted O-linked N-acetylglucosamine transferase (SPINDLY family)